MSAACSPASAMAVVLLKRPTLMGRFSTIRLGPTTKTNGPSGPCWTALTGSASTSRRMSSSTRTLTNWPGQFVNVRVELDIRRDVLALPVRAVQQGPDGPFVFVVGPSRIVEKRPIKVGLLNKSTAIVDAGLQAG